MDIVRKAEKSKRTPKPKVEKLKKQTPKEKITKKVQGIQ